MGNLQKYKNMGCEINIQQHELLQAIQKIFNFRRY